MLDRPEEVGMGMGDHEVSCVGCGSQIRERWFYKTQEGVWHSACLVCTECHRTLDPDEKCFAKHGHLYCRDDYNKLFGVGRCARCTLEISPQELVMRARIYVFHLHCFTCASCHTLLHKGDQFGMRDGQVFCRAHYEAILQEMELEAVAMGAIPGGAMVYPPLSPAAPRLAFYNGVGATQKGRPRKRKIPAEDMPQLTALGPGMGECLLMDMSMEGYRYDHSAMGQNRTKRIRTSFKHHQLRTLKSYFALNQNPDAKDLKQLAQKTEMSKRVLQVWFQNARAKWRRHMLKQEHDRHVGDKLKDGGAGGLLQEMRNLEAAGVGVVPQGLTDLYSMSSGDETSQHTLPFPDMCQGQ